MFNDDNIKKLQNLTETVNNMYEVDSGWQQPSTTISQAPKKNTFEFPTRPTLSGNTTQGLYRSGSGWTYYEGAPVTEQWQNEFNKWVAGGAVGEMPPMQFDRIFENNNAFDFDPDNPNCGWFYHNSVFNALFGSWHDNWGNGILSQLGEAGIIDLPQLDSVDDWGYFYFYLNSNPTIQMMYVQLLFGDPNTPEHNQVVAEWGQWIQNFPWMLPLHQIWQHLYEAQKGSNGAVYFVNPPDGVES